MLRSPDYQTFPGSLDRFTCDALPLAEALQRLLGEHSFLLFYSSAQEGAKLSQLWISARTDRVKRTNNRFVAASDDPFTPPSLSDSTDPAEESIEALTQLILNEQNPVARLDALARLGEYAQEDRRVQTLLSHVARNDFDPQVKAAAEEMLCNLE